MEAFLTASFGPECILEKSSADVLSQLLQFFSITQISQRGRVAGSIQAFLIQPSWVLALANAGNPKISCIDPQMLFTTHVLWSLLMF